MSMKRALAIQYTSGACGDPFIPQSIGKWIWLDFRLGMETKGLMPVLKKSRGRWQYSGTMYIPGSENGFVGGYEATHQTSM